MGKKKFKHKYGAGEGGKKRTDAKVTKAPKASTNRRQKPTKKATTSHWLRNTLLPKNKMEVQLKAVMEEIHEREKLTEDDFAKVKSSIVAQSYGLFVLSAIWTGLSFYLLFEQKFDPTSATVQAAVGCVALLANLLGVLGAKFESDNMLISYLSLMTCLVLITLLVGTFGLVSTEQNVRAYELARERGSSLALTSTVTPEQLRMLSYIIGAMSIIQVPLQGYSVKNAGRMLTTMRAVTNFMETLTILMFPIGCIFIAGGVFIVQNLQDPTSAITALFVFAIGCGIIMLSVLGYFGTLIHSRGMLLLFQWPVLISIIFLFGFGIWATIQADQVKMSLDTYWEDIRRFLPSTFEGRYDKVLFGAFVETNLQMMAFGCFYTGIFFLFCSFGAGLMRQEIKTEHHILKAEEKKLMQILNAEEIAREQHQSVQRLEQQGLTHAQATRQTEVKYNKDKISHMRKFERAHKSEIHKRWKAAWTNGSKFTRSMTKVGCAMVCLILIVVVACGLAFLVYASFCEDLQSICAIQTMTPKMTLPTMINVNNKYRRGTINFGSGGNANAFPEIDSIVDATESNKAVAFMMKSCSLDEGYQQGVATQNEDIPGIINYDIQTVPDPQQFFGVDKSCQKSKIGIAIPSLLVPRVNVTTEGMLNVVGSQTLMLRELALKGITAGATLTKLNIDYTIREDDNLHRAVYINSDLGELKIGDSDEKDACTAWEGNAYTHGRAHDAECPNKIRCR